MTSSTRIIWWVDNEQADENSRAAVEAIDPDACPTTVLPCQRAEQLPAEVRGLRHAYVAPAQAACVCAVLEGLDGVEQVERGPEWEPATVSLDERPLSAAAGLTPRLHSHQLYLCKSPLGVGVLPCQAIPGARGAGVFIVDIERGWALDHEQLAEREVERLMGPDEIDDHGTAVLGILGASDNSRGIRGIVPEATLAVAHGDTDGDERWNPELAIFTALNRALGASAGGVIVLEMQLARAHGLLPVELSDATFRVIELATSQGVHVIEAAGNGGGDLDDPRHDQRFDRKLRDSGAILVGAGGSGLAQTPARARMKFSNHGRRVDVQAWGERVATCGGLREPRYSDLYRPADAEDAARCYTASFHGTSAAAPIVAGCVAAILGACHAVGCAPPKPPAMRALLRQTGVAQHDPQTGRIGPLPNLRAALAELSLS